MIGRVILNMAWLWLQNNGLISDQEYALWTCSPLDTFVRNRQSKFRRQLTRWFKKYSLVGFTDVAYSNSNPNVVKAGIGGLILDKNNKACYIFSGPGFGSNARKVEEHALHHVLEAIWHKQFLGVNILIDSDSLELVSSLSVPNNQASISYCLAYSRSFLKLSWYTLIEG